MIASLYVENTHREHPARPTNIQETGAREGQGREGDRGEMGRHRHRRKGLMFLNTHFFKFPYLIDQL